MCFHISGRLVPFNYVRNPRFVRHVLIFTSNQVNQYQHNCLIESQHSALKQYCT